MKSGDNRKKLLIGLELVVYHRPESNETPGSSQTRCSTQILNSFQKLNSSSPSKTLGHHSEVITFNT